MNLPDGEWAVEGREWRCQECPSCFRQKHFYFNVQKGEGICHGCKIKARSWSEFGKLFSSSFDGSKSWGREFRSIGRETLTNFKEYTKTISPSASTFLESRRVSEDRFEFDSKTGELIAQIDPWSSEYPVEYLRRNILRKKSKWIHYTRTKTSLYGYGLRDHYGSGVLFVEGLFDVLSPQLSGIAVAIHGTNFREEMAQWAVDKGIRKCGIWLDPDPAGMQGTRNALHILRKSGYEPLVFCPEKCGTLPDRCGAARWVEANKEPGDLLADDDLICRVRWEFK